MPAQISAADFVNSVVRLQPPFAAFDCDGTLWSGDAGESFFDWELSRGVVSEQIAQSMRARYADYKAGNVSEDDMCGEMLTMHRGLLLSDVRSLAAEFFEERMAPQIFIEMEELVQRLLESGSDVWAVSSINEWVIEAAMKRFGIPADRILAAAVEIEDGRVTNRLTRVPSGEGKPRAIRETVKRDPDAAFGNSRWDAAMLKIAKHPFAVNPNPDLEEIARSQGWTIYFPTSSRKK